MCKVALLLVLLASDARAAVAQPMTEQPPRWSAGPPTGHLPLLPSPPPPARPRAPPVVEPLRDVPLGALRSSGPDSVVFVLVNAPAPSNAVLRNIEVREEGVSPAYFVQYGGGSLKGRATVNCATGEFLLQSFTFYQRNNLAGEALTHSGPGDNWRAAPAGSVLDRATVLACGGRPRGARAASSGLKRATEPAVAVQQEPRRDTQPPRPAAGGSRPGPRLQVTAAPTEELASRLMGELLRRHPEASAGLSTIVTPAQVNGRRVFRGLISGFSSRAAAVQFCAAVQSRGGDCFVRD